MVMKWRTLSGCSNTLQIVALSVLLLFTFRISTSVCRRSILDIL